MTKNSLFLLLYAPCSLLRALQSTRSRPGKPPASVSSIQALRLVARSSWKRSGKS